MAEYIDRQAAVDALARLCKRVCQYSEKQRQFMCGACPLGDAFTVIEDDLPAADVRPVVRGQWVESKSIMDVIYCSECGFRTIYGAMPDGLGRNYSYCPNCGADMREVTDG